MLSYRYLYPLQYLIRRTILHHMCEWLLKYYCRANSLHTL